MRARSSLSEQQRLTAVALFETGAGERAVATQLGASVAAVRRLYDRWWVRGRATLVTKPTKRTYSLEFELTVVQRFLARRDEGRARAVLAEARRDLGKEVPQRRRGRVTPETGRSPENRSDRSCLAGSVAGDGSVRLADHRLLDRHSPSLALTNSSWRAAIENFSDGQSPLVHSDQGFQYQHVRYLDVDALAASLHEYIHWYNTERISTKLEGLSPVQYRAKALAAWTST